VPGDVASRLPRRRAMSVVVRTVTIRTDWLFRSCLTPPASSLPPTGRGGSAYVSESNCVPTRPCRPRRADGQQVGAGLANLTSADGNQRQTANPPAADPTLLVIPGRRGL